MRCTPLWQGERCRREGRDLTVISACAWPGVLPPAEAASGQICAPVCAYACQACWRRPPPLPPAEALCRLYPSAWFGRPCMLPCSYNATLDPKRLFNVVNGLSRPNNDHNSYSPETVSWPYAREFLGNCDCTKNFNTGK